MHPAAKRKLKIRSRGVGCQAGGVMADRYRAPNKHRGSNNLYELETSAGDRDKEKTVRTLICRAKLALLTMASLSTAPQAETGSIRVVFTKAGFIAGVWGGQGILTH
jgi:hypothetical protein